MTTNTEGLKPCPMCCNQALDTTLLDNKMWLIQCDECGTSTKQHHTDTRAIAAWNRRPTAQASEAAIRNAALEELAIFCDGLAVLYDGAAGFDIGYRMAAQRVGREARALSTMPVEPVTNPHLAIQPEAVDAPLAITGWLPIESAPIGVLSLFCDMTAGELRHSFFVDWIVGGTFCGDRNRRATHWMKLPASPTQSMKADE